MVIVFLGKWSPSHHSFVYLPSNDNDGYSDDIASSTEHATINSFNLHNYRR